ncbi:NAD(P)-dependent alcohol dehydrogenase [Streptomyces griseoviridis]|jgi:propanol-preferring alcohol dehydrogenase|uniref:alcohol dehydrogenase n=3 Tax=Streptomyces TaxID=1883 RepID=A0ABT9L857_STRGD|nr:MULTISPECIES: NAD(P)-dependent alcohol dehydrogenase [Streptomyces]MDP9679888.1 propanol-preferring alcohol dehydrogenase [Streptomyces griseoviridis]GGS68704.1 oxidoreductase [Streptomyces niveoruber]GGT23492.1 oxidoreductase [Streptomyces griseoviridis]GGU65603.1 oxidoreductase [Streptomyces daghestanicus]GHI30162.1 oxidoreductase [Streptomyces daghestanicus]
MKALQYRTIGSPPEVVTVPDPEPGPGQVLLKVTAAGVCHSDIAVMEWPAEGFPYELPLTLGHEGVGTVAALGDGVTGLAEGDAVAVYGPWGCGTCAKCAEGKENYCLRADELGIHPPGLGRPGSMAEYLLIDDPRHLVPLDGLDPVAAVPLTDAGLTPYHAIKKSLPKLGPGSTAVVIGTGGLGHVAIQLLRALTSARVIALDVSEDKLRLAREVGAHETVLSDAGAVEAVREITGPIGAQAVFDFVGVAPTVKTAAGVAGVEADVTLVGIGGAPLPVGFGLTPFEVSVSAPYWGSRSELMEVLALARAGAVSVHTETYSLDDAPLAYQRLHDGKVNGRAVILPNG